jgi:methylmalonyl-CoA/ethylmalonyl-CoA epimerase
VIKGLGHVGVVVGDIQAALSGLCRALGRPVPEVKDVPERRMKVAVLDLGGVQLEFLEDYGPEGWLKKFHDRRGNALHHLALVSDDLEADVASLKARGVRMMFEEPRLGLRGKRIIFTDEQLLGGIPVELSEP